ncbi:hypothetical protein DPMN_091737 [Dreissena polymorpha]|uniref:Uncharacterized protein n=1 Tax=Dreissena polymorpha TaxID=45954 RepID=A0A9D4L021_DREPO|nr:hypothetical protein DPMN_091737 [Dreissena polymorpha]
MVGIRVVTHPSAVLQETGAVAAYEGIEIRAFAGGKIAPVVDGLDKVVPGPGMVTSHPFLET